MACAKPIIVITGENTPLYIFLKDKNCSELITNNRNVNFTQAIRKLAFDKELRVRLGNYGYEEIVKNYSKKVVVSKYANLLKSL
jgi:glycosyltransferase involved in cell wall biosynthesis